MHPLFTAWKRSLKPKRPAESEAVDVLALTPAGHTRHRRFWRLVFQAPVRLNLVGQIREVQLLDLSLKGALVDAGVDLFYPLGTRGRLRLLLSPTAFIAMDVAVARVQGSQLGLQCLHIDLDSVTHLRQLIERNMQDPALLARDLAGLIGDSPGVRVA